MNYTLEKALFIYKPKYATEKFTSDKKYLENHKKKNIKQCEEWGDPFYEHVYERNKPTYVDTVWMYAGYINTNWDESNRVMIKMREKNPNFAYRLVVIHK